MNTNKNSLKISIIVSDLSCSGSGRWGGAVRPFLLGQALQKMGHQVKIFGLGFGEQTPKFSTKIPIVYIPCQYHSGIISASKQLLNQIDGDIIYAIKLKTTSFGLGIIKKLTSNSPLILDIDDWEMSWHGGDNWKLGFKPIELIKDIIKKDGALRYPDHPLYLRWLEKFTSYADVITTHNTFLQKRFGGVYIPQGKDLEIFNPDKFDAFSCKTKYGLEKYRVLMFPGAPRPYKGLEDLLQAMDLLQWEDLKLVIVGGSPYDDYDQYLQKRWSKWIISIPPLSFEEMPEIISCADVMVIPQRNTPETIAQFPLKLTDAMAMAKPILATKVGDIPEILQNTGYLAEPESPKDLAQNLKIIFSEHNKAKEKGIQARERYQRYYSLEQMTFILDQVLSSFSIA